MSTAALLRVLVPDTDLSGLDDSAREALALRTLAALCGGSLAPTNGFIQREYRRRMAESQDFRAEILLS